MLYFWLLFKLSWPQSPHKYNTDSVNEFAQQKKGANCQRIYSISQVKSNKNANDNISQI